VTVLVTGGTGFVGSRVVRALRAHGQEVRALVRRPERGAGLASLGAELVAGDVTDPASLRAAAAGCSAVVHLVAIIKGGPADFDRVMTQGTKNLVAAAREQGVRRFVLMSALGTTEQTKDVVPYYAAKWAMEQEVSSSGFEHTIFRPSFVFGRGGALPTFIRQVRYSPVVTVIGSGLQRIQPIWVDDVAEYFAAALERRDTFGRTFELGGPDAVTWNELYQTIARVLHKRRRLAHVPIGAARTGARVVERLPGAPLTADQVTMIEAGDNVPSDTSAVDTFRLPLVPLEEQIRRVA
jgi:uncharacterized protein YbjT (DUF2867 family)